MRTLVLGVNGMTGQAIATDLALAGHEVVGTGRAAQRFPDRLRDCGVHFLESDRHDPAAVAAALGDGADVVVDCVAYTAEHARMLLAASGDIGSIVALSSKAVYVDAHGRHSNSAEPPDFGTPVSEDTAVLPPDFSGDYKSAAGYGRNKVAMELTLRQAAVPVSVLRPSRIHGLGSARPREWWVVRQILRGVRTIPLAHGGRTGNHPTAAVNLARLVLACARQPGHRVVNSADPGAPTAADVVRAIAAAMSAEVEVTDAGPGRPAASPWDTWPPFFLDTSAAQEVGYEPVGDYAATVGPVVRELATLSADRREALDADPYFGDR